MEILTLKQDLERVKAQAEASKREAEQLKLKVRELSGALAAASSEEEAKQSPRKLVREAPPEQPTKPPLPPSAQDETGFGCELKKVQQLLEERTLDAEVARGEALSMRARADELSHNLERVQLELARKSSMYEARVRTEAGVMHELEAKLSHSEQCAERLREALRTCEERRKADVHAAEERARNSPELDKLRVQNAMLREEVDQLRKQLESLGGRIKRLHGQFDGESVEERQFRETLENVMREQQEIEDEMASAEPPTTLAERRIAASGLAQVSNGRRAGRPVPPDRTGLYSGRRLPSGSRSAPANTLEASTGPPRPAVAAALERVLAVGLGKGGPVDDELSAFVEGLSPERSGGKPRRMPVERRTPQQRMEELDPEAGERRKQMQALRQRMRNTATGVNTR
ncbi:hypothetical protein AB1Y20_007259 [Prymnesium parvum]|uniref:Uncharacterized protein n=1 Tax=Prymnesium parvum TaxID=97485 RepID=A0AB34IWU8_PRYPA